MRVIFLLLLPLVTADYYKSTNNFQYSRTGSDGQTETGYYGSQTGNAGGNYEVSHNMDNYARDQMNNDDDYDANQQSTWNGFGGNDFSEVNW